MKISLFETHDAKWGAVLERCPHDCYHTPGWMRAAEYGDRGTAFALHVSDDRGEMLVPLVRRELPGGRWDAVSPYGYGGPVLSGHADEHFIDRALGLAVDALRDAGCVSWFIRLHPLLNADWRSSIGHLVEHGRTVSIDLTKSAAEHWRETVHGHRNDINKAKRAGVEVYIVDAFSRLGHFVELYNRSMQRLEAGSYYNFNEQYYQTLRREMGPNLRLFVAEEAGEVIGAALLTVAPSTGILQGHLFGASEQHRHRQPLKVLIHAQREWGREHGYRYLNLGGGRGRGNETEDSLFRFKRGFSPDAQAFRTLRVVVDPQCYAALCDGMGGGAAPADLSGFFPAYRQTATPAK